MSLLSDNVTRKFIDTLNVSEWEIDTDTGWHDIDKVMMTIPYQVWRLTLVDGSILEGADTHIIFDEYLQEVFLKDVHVDDLIAVRDGFIRVASIEVLDNVESMYDIEVNSVDHRFYSGNILSHNSVTVVSYFLWVLLFHDNQNLAILANKGALARDLLSKVKLAYEYLPMWIQQGICVWNKGNVELENGSKILAASTTSSAVRGGSYNLIFLDEFAFVAPNMATEFFASVYPTISSGKTTKMLIVSTPNGLNHFYKMWMDAEKKKSLYNPVEVHWSSVPGRDEKWKEDTIRNTSQEQFDQEHNCVGASTQVKVRDIITGDICLMSIEDLYKRV